MHNQQLSPTLSPLSSSGPRVPISQLLLWKKVYCWGWPFFTLYESMSLYFQLLILYWQRDTCWQDLDGPSPALYFIRVRLSSPAQRQSRKVSEVVSLLIGCNNEPSQWPISEAGRRVELPRERGMLWEAAVWRQTGSEIGTRGERYRACHVAVTR